VYTPGQPAPWAAAAGVPGFYRLPAPCPYARAKSAKSSGRRRRPREGRQITPFYASTKHTLALGLRRQRREAKETKRNLKML
jgi:hypothetical protein